jgi:hypothetical protein
MKDDGTLYYGVYLSHDDTQIRLAKDFLKATINQHKSYSNYALENTLTVFLPENHPIPTTVEEFHLLAAIHPTHIRSGKNIDNPFTS